VIYAINAAAAIPKQRRADQSARSQRDANAMWTAALISLYRAGGEGGSVRPRISIPSGILSMIRRRLIRVAAGSSFRAYDPFYLPFIFLLFFFFMEHPSRA